MRRRLLTLIAVLSLGAAGCGAVPSEVFTTESPGDLPAGLTSALGQGTEVASGRMEGAITVTGATGGPGDEIAISFSGAFDNRTGAFQFAMDFAGLAGLGGEDIPPGLDGLLGGIEILQVGDEAYMKMPFFAALLGAEAEWIRFPADDPATMTGVGGPTPGNPAEFLAAFEDANGTVEDLGRETVRDVETTHYLVTFDLEDLIPRLTPKQVAELESQGPLPIDELPMDIWIGDDGLVYRFAIVLDGDDVETAPGEAFDTMSMVFEMFDWGTDVVVEPPPPEAVIDLEDLNLFDPSMFEGLDPELFADLDLSDFGDFGNSTTP